LTTANVVDVSEWQPTSIDWANLKTNGVKAVVVRIGHGTTRDTNAADHISNATKAGLIVMLSLLRRRGRRTAVFGQQCQEP
jgi:GH25 family lysozyme M1 (1,4-beta-N-acetylmuramidase)